MAHLTAGEIPLLTAYLEERTPPIWTIKRSNLGGRGLFAVQTIKKGTLIFKNKPLVVAPRADRAGDTYCSVCYQVSDSCYSCAQCSLMVCSEECRTCQDHDVECSFITNNWKLKPDCSGHPGLLARMQIYLRFLLLPEEHKLLLSILQSCTNEAKFEELEILLTKYDIPEDQIIFMKFVHSIIKINSYRIANNPHDRKIPLRGLFPLSAFLNHSCVPNTRNVFNADHTMAVYATRDIEGGEEILTCYTGLLLCTPARRCQLYKTKRFWCKCARCRDTTEMGTKLSALKCLKKECVGILLPSSPLDPRGEWCCDNCSSRASPDEICTIQSILGSLVGSLDLDDQFRLETAILARLANFIPYSNHIFIDLRLRLALKIGFTEGLNLHGI